MSERTEVRIGGKVGGFVSIRRLTRNGPEGWFDAEVEVQCDGWHGVMRASFMRGELTRFAEEIKILYKELRGEARFEPIEPHLTLSFVGDGKGHIEVVGTARNHFDRGTKLSFSLEADQTYLPAIAKALYVTESSEPS
jgi:hypothetical protein